MHDGKVHGVSNCYRWKVARFNLTSGKKQTNDERIRAFSDCVKDMFKCCAQFELISDIFFRGPDVRIGEVAFNIF